MEKIETLTEFAQAQGLSPAALAAAEREGLLAVHRAGGRRLVVCETVSDDVLDFARRFDDGEEFNEAEPNDGYDDADDGYDDADDGYDDDDYL